jgi:hypothetical protein
MGKSRGLVGELNPACTITDTTVTYIRSEWVGGRTQTSISRELGISQAQICRIVNGTRRGSPERVSRTPTGNLKSIPGWPGYLVSDNGDVYTCRTTGGGFHPGRWVRMKTPPNPDGYPSVRLHDGRGGSVSWLVHTLVLTLFVGPRPKGMLGCHNNGIKTDNHVGNLRWGTPKSNMDDRESHGRTAKGARGGTAKLTSAQVIKARKLRQEGMGPTRIIRTLGVKVCRSTMTRAVDGRHWKHLKQGD